MLKTMAKRALKMAGLRALPPVRRRNGVSVQILDYPGTHLFISYYDVQPFSSDDEFLLAHRLPLGCERIEVGRVHLVDGRFEPLGQSDLWSWQLGTRMQYLDPRRIVFNSLVDARPGALIYNLETGDLEALPHTVFALSNDRTDVATLDFGRLYNKRAGYGYRVLASRPDPSISPGSILVYERKGGQNRYEIGALTVGDFLAERGLVESVAEIYLNHPLYEPNGNRFAFIAAIEDQHRRTFLLVADAPSGEIISAMPKHGASHFWWDNRGNLSLFVCERGLLGNFWTWNPENGDIQKMGLAWPSADGHQTQGSDGNWVVDSYPDRLGFQCLRMVNSSGDRSIELARFRAPLGMAFNKCDLHPRRSASGQRIAVDTAYDGRRRIAIIDAIPERLTCQ